MADNNTRFILSAVDQTGPAFESVRRGLSGVESMAGTLGITLSAVGMMAFIQHNINAADELSKLSQKTGTAVETLAGLKYAADQNGTSLESVANAAKKLSASLVDQPKLFAELGVTAKDSTGAMVQMADIFAYMPDGVEKTALAVKLMGKSGEEMIPFLNQGSASLEGFIEQGKKFNPVTAEAAQQAADFNDNLDALKAQSGALGTIMANTMLPTLVKISEAMKDAAADGGNLKAIWVGLGGVGTAIFTNDMLDRDVQIAKRRAQIQEEISNRTSRFIDREKTEWYKKLTAEDAALNQELSGLNKEKSIADERKKFREQMSALHVTAPQSKIYEMAKFGASDAAISAEQEKVNKAMSAVKALDGQGADSIKARSLAEWTAAENAKIIAMNIETASGEKLGESYKALIKLNEEQKNSLTALTGVEYIQKAAMLERGVVAETALKQSEADKKALEDYDKASQQYMSALGSETVALIEKASAAEYENSLIGKTPDQLAALIEARYNEQIGIQAVEAARLDGIAGREAELFIVNQKISALAKLRDEESKKPKLEEASKLDGVMSANLSQSLTDSIMRGFENGKPFAQNFADSFSSMIKTSIIEKSIKGSLDNLVTKGTLGKGDTMTSAEKGAMYLAVAAVAVSYLGNKETVMSAQQRQALQGTGTVLGDYNAKSASIANGIDLIAKASTYGTSVTESMAASLKSVDANMRDFLTTAVKSMGGSFSANMGIVPGQMSNPALRDTGIAAGAAAGAAIGSYFGPWGTVIGGALGALGGATSRTDRVVADKGLNIDGTLGQFRTGGGSINQYVSGVDNSSSMFGLYNSSDAWRKTQAVDGGVNTAFANIFTGVADTFKTAAAAMGKDASTFDAVMNGMSVNIGDLSLMNMSVTEQQTAIMNVVSQTSDQMASKLFPEMVKFNAAGEGMAQTVIRVVTQNEAVITAFNRMGGAQTQISHSTFAMTDELTRAAGGLDKLLPSLQQFTKFYTTSANQFANSYADAKRQFSGTAIDGLVSKQTTADDIAAYVRAAMASGIDANSKVRILDAANSFSSFLTSMKNGIDALRASYDGVTSARDGVVGSIKSLQAFNVSLQEFRRSVVVDNALLDPTAKAAAARIYFNDIAAKSAAGDAVAQGKLQSAGQSLLSASQNGGSYAQYQSDVSLVLKSVDATAAYNDKAINNGRDMLSTLDSMNGISGEISKNTFATNTAIMDMARVLGGYAAATSALSIASSNASPEAKQALASYVGKSDSNFSSVLNALQQGGGSGAIGGSVANQPVSSATPSSASSAASYAAAEAKYAEQADAQAKATRDAQAAAQAAAQEAAASEARKQAKAAALTFYNSYIPDKNFHTTSEHGEWLRSLPALQRQHVDKFGTDFSSLPSQLQKHNKWLSDKTAAKAAYDALPSFAIGSNYIVRDTLAQIHAGEEITPRPYVDLQRTARDETNALLARLVASNDELRTELKQLTENQIKDNTVIKANTAATAGLLDDATGGGRPVQVKVVSA